MTFFIKPKTTRVINQNISTIPWDEASRIYAEAADQAEEATLASVKYAYDQAYKKRRADAIRLAGIDESEVNYEGDLGFSYSPPTISAVDMKAARNKAGAEALQEQFIKPYQIKSWGTSILNQLVSLLKGHRLNTAGVGGTISGLQYLKDNLDPKSERDLGIYRFLMLDSRSSYLEKMVSSENKQFCTLVPLILYAHKLYNSVEYSRWERETLSFVVNPSLCDAMLTEIDGSISTERLLELREHGLTVMSGAKQGEVRNPATTYGLYRLAGTELEGYNSLTNIMLTQIWAAHPNNRTKYMILDPMNWDVMPPPLVSSAIFVPSTNSVPSIPKASRTGGWDQI
jgi:hypothetical protein